MIPTKRTGEYEVHFKTPRKNGGRSTARNRKRRPLRNGVLSFSIGKVSFLLLVLLEEDTITILGGWCGGLDIYSMLAGPVEKRLKSGRIWMNRWKLRRLRTELTLRLVGEAACGRRPPAFAKSAAAAFDLHEKRMTLTRSVFTQRAEIKILH
jgi:hypothetical protein